MAYAAAALFGAVLWWPMLGPPSLEGDAREYVAIGRTLAEHGAYGFTPGVPTMYREPGYPLFLAGVFVLFGSGMGVLLVFLPLLQLAMLVAAAMLLEAIILELWPGRRRSAIAAGVLLVGYPIMIQYANLLLTETLALLLLHVIAYAWLRLMRAEQEAWRWGALAGVASGWVVLTRLTWLFLPLAMAAVAVFLRRYTAPRRAAIALAAIVPFLFAGVWIGRNCLTFGTCAPAGRAGMLTYAHAVKPELPQESKERYLLATLAGDFFVSYHDPAFRLRDVDGLTAHIPEWDMLKAEGWSDERVEAHFSAKAKELIIRHPFAYLGYGLLEVWKLTTPLFFKGPTAGTFAGVHPPAPFWPHAAVLIAIRIWTAAFLVALALGMIRLARTRAYGLIVAMPVAYHILIHILLDAIPRYFLPVAALAWIVVVLGAAPILLRAFSFLRRVPAVKMGRS